MMKAGTANSMLHSHSWRHFSICRDASTLDKRLADLHNNTAGPTSWRWRSRTGLLPAFLGSEASKPAWAIADIMSRRPSKLGSYVTSAHAASRLT